MKELLDKTSNGRSRFFQPILTDNHKTLKRAMITAMIASSVSMGSAYADNGTDELSTIFHVYYNGERIGTVSDKSVIETIINQKIEKAELKNSNFTFTAADIAYIPEQVFEPVYNNDAAAASVKNEVGVLAEASAIMIGDKPVAYVKDRQEAESVIKTIKDKFIPTETDGSTIIDVRFSEKVSINAGKTKIKNILPADKAVELILKGTLEPKKYTVQEGDVLGTIAAQFDLTVAKMLEINPGLKEDSILQIGDELVVMAYQPLVQVVATEQVTKKVEIPYETEVTKDESLFKGESSTIQQGKNGEKNVTYQIVRENGVVTNKEVTKEEIVNEPQKKLIKEGTKVIPSRGTGELTWPAVGGVITSPMGYRWGRLHKGIDISGVSDRTIKAADNGVVTFAGWDGSYGYRVVINHNNGMKTTYNHMASVSVRNGQTVQKGRKVGVMGTTGNSTGVHLHFEVFENGKLMDPQTYY